MGWFQEPNCGSCHTGTASSNSGQIRYTSVFTDANWHHIEIGNPILISEGRSGANVTVTWPEPNSDVVLESSLLPFGPWSWVTNAPVNNTVTLRAGENSQYFRLRRPW